MVRPGLCPKNVLNLGAPFKIFSLLLATTVCKLVSLIRRLWDSGGPVVVGAASVGRRPGRSGRLTPFPLSVLSIPVSGSSDVRVRL